ncbi:MULTISPECIES: hypothetical protein [Bacillaceae]|uniref:Uncharacterized protein n=1 Tax=Peribacillus huizhouensis TaxID=1501239 RepID=A0ABR6CWJ0_9BACI|nr:MULTISPECIES: hypothetical protein [Bacillaceae]MBA9029091.1 hypothetical protein [Peribacillus huizhouensis]
MRDVIHDCFVDVLGTAPSEQQIDEVLKNLPSEINLLIEKDGEDNQKVRDNIYVWVNENINDFI